MGFRVENKGGEVVVVVVVGGWGGGVVKTGTTREETGSCVAVVSSVGFADVNMMTVGFSC